MSFGSNDFISGQQYEQQLNRIDSNDLDRRAVAKLQKWIDHADKLKAQIARLELRAIRAEALSDARLSVSRELRSHLTDARPSDPLLAPGVTANKLDDAFKQRVESLGYRVTNFDTMDIATR